MPVLAQGVATRSRDPVLLIENKLEVGSWRFRLTVVDDSGLESDPTELVVRVVRPTIPSGLVPPPVDTGIRPPRPTPGPIRPTTPVRPVRRPGRSRRPPP
jgi:hypothetical protein